MGRVTLDRYKPVPGLTPVGDTVGGSLPNDSSTNHQYSNPSLPPVFSPV